MVSTYLGKVTVKLDEETEEAMEDFDLLQGKIADLTKTAKTPGGLSLFTDANKTEYKSTYQFLKDLSEIYHDLTDKQQAEVLEAVAGKRGGQVLAGILDDFSEVERAMFEMSQAANSADNEMGIVEQSIAYKLNALKQTWIGLLQELIDRGDIGELIDSFTDLSEALATLIKQIGLVPSLGVVLGGLFAFNKPTEFKAMIDMLKDLPGLFKSISTAFKMVETAKEQAEGLGEVITTAEAAKRVASTGSEEFTGLGAALAKIPPQAWLVVAALAALGGVAYKTYQANESLKKSAKESADSFETAKKDINSYKDKVSELQAVLKNDKSSYQEMRDAREQLLSIQNELKDKYGEEARNIDLVTTSINNQIDALDILEKKEWQKTKRDFNNQNLPGFESILRFMEGVEDNSALAIKKMERKSVDFRLDSVESGNAGNILDNYGITQIGDTQNFKIEGDNLEEIYNKLLKVQQAVEHNGYSWAGLNKAINEVEEELNTFGAYYEQYVLNERILETQYEETFVKMQGAYEDYVEAVKDGNEEAVQDAKDNAIGIVALLNSSLAKDNTLDEQAKQSIRNYVMNMYDVFQSEFAKYNFTPSGFAINLRDNGFEGDEEQKLTEALGKFANERVLLSLENENEYQSRSKIQQEAYDYIKSIADNYNLDIKELVAILRERNQKIADEFSRDANNPMIQAYKDSLKQSGTDLVIMPEVDTTKIDVALNYLNDETYEKVKMFNNTIWDEVSKYAKENFGTSYLPDLSTDQMVEAITNVADAWSNVDGKLQKVQEDMPEFDTKAFSEQISDLSSLSSLYDKFVEKVKNGEKDLSLDIGDIESLREKFGDLDNFNTFEKIVTDANSAEEQVQAAFDQMATDFVNAKMDLSNASFDDMGFIETQIEKQGLLTEGVQKYVHERIIANQAEQRANEIKASGNSVNDQTIRTLISEGQQAGLTKNELLNYAAAFANASGLKMSGDVSWLKTLIAELKLAENELRTFGNLMKQYSIGSKVSSTKNLTSISSDVLAKRNAMYDRKQKYDYDKALNDAGGSGSGGGGGGGGGAKDEAEETKDIMAELSSQLDEIQSKWESLTDILDHYNETGKVTIDQAQELFQTDWKYLALLGDGTGIVQNADEAFQSLAEAKINEMRVQLARNAIDAINGLNDEAEAAKYLTNAYLDLKDGALAAEEAILKMALATKQAQGGNIAAAAEMIYKGYQNAKMLTANIDYSKKDKDSDKDKDKDFDKNSSRADSDANSKKNKYSKDFNWIERLLERLNKLTEKWTNQADRFFTYWNKNWAIDRAVQSNRNEINANEQALVYYNDLLKNIKIKDDIKAKIQNGAIDIETIRREKLGTKVEEYVNYYDKMIELQEKINDLYENERNLLRQKLDNITSYFDTIEDYYSSLSSLISARIETKNASGQRTSMNDLLKQFISEEDLKEVAEDRLTAVVTGVAIDKLRTEEDIRADQAEAGSTAIDTDYYKKVSERQKELEAKETAYQEAETKIVDLQEKIKNEKNKEAKKQLQAELKQAKKDKNANKLSKKEQKELANLQQQAANMESLGETVIDSAISSLGSYQELQQEIAGLQSKSKLSKKESKRLEMLQSMFASINEGVAAESLSDYISLYEDWWNLKAKESAKILTAKERLKLNELEERKNAIESSYISTSSVLDEELNQVQILRDEELSLEEKREALGNRYNELEESYNKQYADTRDAYKNTSEYKKLLAERDTELEKKNDGKKYNVTKLAKLEAELEALENGATVENIKEFIKIWEKAYKNGTQDTNDTIQLWNKAKKETLDAIKKEKDDALREVTLEQEKAETDAETNIEEKKQQLWATAKEIANWQVNSIQYLIDALNTTISNYKNVASLLESTNLDNLKKYGVIDYLGLSDSKTLEENLETTLQSAIAATEKKIPSLIEQGNLLQELINAGNANSFEGIFAKYRASSSVETQAAIDNMIKMLNENNYTDNEWMVEWQNQFAQIQNDLGFSIQEIQQFKDELRENVYFKAINNSITQIENLNNQLDSMASLIKDEWTSTVTDGITEYGLVKVKLLAQEMGNAQQQVGNYYEKLQKVQELGVESYGEAYETALTEAWSNYYGALSNVESIQEQIYQIGRKAQEDEVEAVRKTIEAYKEAAQKRKSYYEYDKTIREKTRSIEALQAEARALANVSNAASKARVRQLEEQIKEAQEDLDHTKQEHEFEMMEQALDDLITRMEQALDNSTKSIDETIENFYKIVSDIIERSGAANNASLEKIYNYIMGTKASSNTSEKSEENPSISSIQTDADIEVPKTQIEYKKISAESLQAMGYDTNTIAALTASTNTSTLNTEKTTSTLNDSLKSLTSVDFNKHLSQINSTLYEIRDNNKSQMKTLIDTLNNKNVSIMIDGRSFANYDHLYSELKRLGINVTYR